MQGRAKAIDDDKVIRRCRQFSEPIKLLAETSDGGATGEDNSRTASSVDQATQSKLYRQSVHGGEIK